MASPVHKWYQFTMGRFVSAFHIFPHHTLVIMTFVHLRLSDSGSGCWSGRRRTVIGRSDVSSRDSSSSHSWRSHLVSVTLARSELLDKVSDCYRCYQLFITFGIFLAACINYGTQKTDDNSSWLIPLGIGFIWGGMLTVGMLFFSETPRFVYRRGHVDQARKIMSRGKFCGPNRGCFPFWSLADSR